MMLYKYDPSTKELTGSKPAQRRPNGQPITDALNATTVEPPVLEDKQAAVWNGERWDVLEDHRKKSGVEGSGTPYWLPGDAWNTPARYMTELGPLPEGALLEAPGKDVDTLRADKLAEINGKYNAATSALVSTYPSTELLTFDKQEQEARAYTAAPEAETPLVNALAAGRLMDKDELVRRIIAKADAFALAVGYYTGQRQHYEDQLAEAVTAADISAIVPVYALPDTSQSEEATTEQSVEPTTAPETEPETPEIEQPAETEATA